MKRVKRISRREVLAISAGSVTLGLPWLEYYAAPQKAWAAPPLGMTESGHPKRLVICFSDYGTLRNEWGDGDDSSIQLGKLLQPMSAHQDRMTLIKGLYQTGNNGAHPAGITGALTGGELVGNKNASTDVGGPSVDQRIAQEVGKDLPRPALTASLQGLQRPITYKARNQAVSPYQDPHKAFKEIFEGVQPSEPGEVADPKGDALVEGRKKVLEASMARFDALKGRVGAEDSARLDSHLAGLNTLIGRLDGAGGGSTAGCNTTFNGGNALPGPGSNFMTGSHRERTSPRVHAISNAYMDIFTQAFSCDITRTAVINLGHFQQHPNESHAATQGNPNTGAYKGVLEAGLETSKRVNYLLDALTAAQEGEGSIMDNTVVMWIYSLADGNAHNRNDSRHLLVGNAGGTFKTGRTINMNAGAKIEHNRLLTSLINVFGIEANHFGDPRWGNGPLTELGVSV